MEKDKKKKSDINRKPQEYYPEVFKLLTPKGHVNLVGKPITSFSN
jgi:hypothetical protein